MCLHRNECWGRRQLAEASARLHAATDSLMELRGAEASAPADLREGFALLVADAQDALDAAATERQKAERRLTAHAESTTTDHANALAWWAENFYKVEDDPALQDNSPDDIVRRGIDHLVELGGRNCHVDPDLVTPARAAWILSGSESGRVTDTDRKVGGGARIAARRKGGKR